MQLRRHNCHPLHSVGLGCSPRGVLSGADCQRKLQDLWGCTWGFQTLCTQVYEGLQQAPV